MTNPKAPGYRRPRDRWPDMMPHATSWQTRNWLAELEAKVEELEARIAALEPPPAAAKPGPCPRPNAGGEYNAADDFARSIDEAYREIRARQAAGGPGWEPPEPLDMRQTKKEP